MPGSLLRLETRRSVGAWLVLAIPVALWLMFSQGLLKVAPLWFETSLIARNSLTLLGPLVAGAAAWMAGRDKRRGLGDLLATTAYPPAARLLTAWLGTTLWGVLGYLVPGVVVVALSASRATWGGPFIGPMLVGLVAIPTCAALGFALGYHLPNHLTAPLGAVALFFGQIIVGELRAWYAFLSPLVSLSKSVWSGVLPHMDPYQLGFLLGLGGLALGSVALRAQPGRPARFACLALALVTIASMALLWRDAPRRGGQSLSLDPRYRALQLNPIPYTPVCAEATVPVCVHPAYQPYLNDTTATINQLLAPVLGLPGVPTRAEQGYVSMLGPRAEPTLWFDIYPQSGYPKLAFLVANQLIRERALSPAAFAANCPAANPSSCHFAQFVIGRWLLRQAGLPDAGTFSMSSDGTDSMRGAVDRFAALDPALQRAWLEAHFADLRVGKVRLEDMP